MWNPYLRGGLLAQIWEKVMIIHGNKDELDLLKNGERSSIKLGDTTI